MRHWITRTGLAWVMAASLPAAAAVANAPRPTPTRPPAPPPTERLPIGTHQLVGSGFRIVLPSPPTEESSLERLPDGRRVSITRGRSVQGADTYGYVVLWSAEPLGGDLMHRLHELAAGFLEAQADLEVVGTMDSFHLGHPAIDMRLESPADGRTVIARMLIGHRGAYLATVTFRGGLTPPARALAARYLDGMSPVPNDAPSAAGRGQGNGDPTWIAPPEAYFAASMPDGVERSSGRVREGAHDYHVFRYDVGVRGEQAHARVEVLVYEGSRPDGAFATYAEHLTGTGTRLREVWTSREGFPSLRFELDVEGRHRHVEIVQTGFALYGLTFDYEAEHEARYVETRDTFFASFTPLTEED